MGELGCGSVNSVRIMYRDDGKSRGFGYADLSSAAREQFLQVTDAVLDGRTLKFDKADKKTPRPSMGGAPGQLSAESSTLFVKNLSFRADENSVWEIFGDAKSVRIVTDRETGNSKGFGYVEFEDVDSAKTALNTNQGVSIAGREVFLDFATPRAPRPEGGRGGFRGGRGGGRGGSFRGGRGGRGGSRPNSAQTARRGNVQEFQGSKMTFDE